MLDLKHNSIYVKYRNIVNKVLLDKPDIPGIFFIGNKANPSAASSSAPVSRSIQGSLSSPTARGKVVKRKAAETEDDDGEGDEYEAARVKSTPRKKRKAVYAEEEENGDEWGAMSPKRKKVGAGSAYAPVMDKIVDSERSSDADAEGELDDGWEI